MHCYLTYEEYSYSALYACPELRKLQSVPVLQALLLSENVPETGSVRSG
jgi:hypothetical protein